MSDKELDQLFQSRFESFEAEPAASLWSSIESQLESKPEKRAGLPVFWMAAASVVVLLGAGLWLFRPEEKVYLKGNSVLAKVHEVPAENTEPETQEAPVPPVAESASVSSPSREHVRVRQKEPEQYLAATEQKAHEPALSQASESQTMMSKTEEPVTDKHTVPVMAAVETEEVSHTRRGEVHQTVLAMLPPEESGEPEKLRERRKIRSVGDIVNFVVAKVDQREDKLIELADDDEGTKISAINLGLFKIKSKKR